jgi:hypothetical protein
VVGRVDPDTGQAAGGHPQRGLSAAGGAIIAAMTRLSLRAGALLAAGSLAVHELRYQLGYGGEGAVGGHGYLTWLAPLVALTLAAACGVWLARIGRGSDRAADGGRGLTWLGASASLLLTYVAQETVEALAAPGHPGLLAHGGWVVVPIALAVGAAVSLLLRGARAADRAAATAARPWSPLRLSALAPPVFLRPAAAPLAPRPRVLARRLAGRGPPLAS